MTRPELLVTADAVVSFGAASADGPYETRVADENLAERGLRDWLGQEVWWRADFRARRGSLP